MKRFKWRIVLSVSNVILALAMSAIGLHEYQIDHQMHPEYFYHGNVYYLPIAQILSYCWNIPAFVISNLFRNVGMQYLAPESGLFEAHSFFNVYKGYYVVVFLFWWCIGWRLDEKANLLVRKRRIAIIGYVLGALLSLTLAYYGIVVLRGEVVARAIPVSMLFWGFGLLYYFGIRLLRVRSEVWEAGRGL